jgi:hypothetical protein
VAGAGERADRGTGGQPGEGGMGVKDMTDAEKLARIHHIASTAHAVIGNYVNSRLAIDNILDVLDDEPDEWDDFVLPPGIYDNR